MRIALLGLGRMGTALGRRLLDGGHELTAWNRSPAKASEIAAAGARVAAGPAEATVEAEVTITMLANDAAVRAVALGKDGVVAALPAGAVYADCSTVSPALSSELVAAAGADRFLAMPVLGAPRAVLGGAAEYLAGGSDTAFDRLAPLSATLGGRVRRYPTPGPASAAKLATNLMLLAGVMALAESFSVARSGGLSEDEIHDLLAGSRVVAPALGNRFEGILTGRQDPWWTTTLGAKDAGLAVDVAAAAGVDLPLAGTVRDGFARAASAGHDDEDIVAVRQLYEAGG